MKELLPMNSYGILATKDKELYVDSRKVAEFFDKEHCHVMRDINDLITKIRKIEDNPKTDSPVDGINYSSIRIIKSKYKNLQNKYQPCYKLNKDAFMLLCMSYKTEKALKIKLWYIECFNEMEKQLKAYLALKDEYPAFTKALSQIKTDNPYLYSTENDLVYKVATGLSARQWRKALGLKKCESIRPHLTPEQCESVNDVQRYDSVLLDLYGDYDMRKTLLISKFKKDDK